MPTRTGGTKLASVWVGAASHVQGSGYATSPVGALQLKAESTYRVSQSCAKGMADKWSQAPARPAQNPFTSRSLQRARLPPQFKHGSLYRCSKST